MVNLFRGNRLLKNERLLVELLSWIKGDGLDAPGAQYMRGNQVINSGRVTTLSNYSIVSESRVVKKPADLSFDEAILFG